MNDATIPVPTNQPQPVVLLPSSNPADQGTIPTNVPDVQVLDAGVPATVSQGSSQDPSQDTYVVLGDSGSYALTFKADGPPGETAWHLTLLDGDGRKVGTFAIPRGSPGMTIDVGSANGSPVRSFLVSLAASPTPTVGRESHYSLEVSPSPPVSHAPASTDLSSSLAGLLAMMPDDLLGEGLSEESPHKSPQPTRQPKITGGGGESSTDSMYNPGRSSPPLPGRMSWGRPSEDDPPVDGSGTEAAGDGTERAASGAPTIADIGPPDSSLGSLASVDPVRGLIDAPGGPPISTDPTAGSIQLAGWLPSEGEIPIDPAFAGMSRRPREGDRGRSDAFYGRAIIGSALSVALTVPNLVVLRWSRKERPRNGQRPPVHHSPADS